MWWFFRKKYKKIVRRAFWSERIEGFGFGNLLKPVKNRLPDWFPKSIINWLPLGLILFPFVSAWGLLAALGLVTALQLLPINNFAYKYKIPKIFLTTTSFEDERQEMRDGIFYGILGLCVAAALPMIVYAYASSFISIALYGVILPLVTATVSTMLIISGISFNYEVPSPSNHDELADEPPVSICDILSETVTERVGILPCWSFNLWSSSRDPRDRAESQESIPEQRESSKYRCL